MFWINDVAAAAAAAEGGREGEAFHQPSPAPALRANLNVLLVVCTLKQVKDLVVSGIVCTFAALPEDIDATLGSDVVT